MEKEEGIRLIDTIFLEKRDRGVIIEEGSLKEKNAIEKKTKRGE